MTRSRSGLRRGDSNPQTNPSTHTSGRDAAVLAESSAQANSKSPARRSRTSESVPRALAPQNSNAGDPFASLLPVPKAFSNPQDRPPSPSRDRAPLLL